MLRFKSMPRRCSRFSTPRQKGNGKERHDGRPPWDGPDQAGGLAPIPEEPLPRRARSSTSPGGLDADSGADTIRIGPVQGLGGSGPEESQAQGRQGVPKGKPQAQIGWRLAESTSRPFGRGEHEWMGGRRRGGDARGVDVLRVARNPCFSGVRAPVADRRPRSAVAHAPPNRLDNPVATS